MAPQNGLPPEVGRDRLRSWSVQRARGRPGPCLQSPPNERPDVRPTWQFRALCAYTSRFPYKYYFGK